MTASYEDALEAAISLAGDDAALTRYLASVPQWRDRLQADLSLIIGLSGESDPLSPTSAEHDRVAQRFRTALANSITPEASRHSWLQRLPFSRPRFVAGFAMASAAVILALFSVGIRFDFGGGIQSIVVSGRIDTVSASSVTVNTGSSTRTVALATTSGFFDAFGNPVDPSWLQPGHTVSLTARKSGNDLVAERLELSGQLVGTIVSVDASSITLRGVNGDYVVQTTPSTKLEGAASPGSQVEIQLSPGDDGNLVANEIESHGGGGEDQGHEGNEQKDDDSPHATATPVATSTPVSPALTLQPQEGHVPESEHDESESSGAPPTTVSVVDQAVSQATSVASPYAGEYESGNQNQDGSGGASGSSGATGSSGTSGATGSSGSEGSNDSSGSESSSQDQTGSEHSSTGSGEPDD